MKSLKTGFNELDKLINGLNGGDLIGIAARRGMCKTSFGINLINNVSKQTNKRILYFNLDSLKENNLSKKIINNNVEVIDDVSLIEDIKNKCEEANKQDISLVVIDYLQLITNNKKYKSKLAKTLDELPILKVLALELNIPIIIISRLSKIIDKREYKKPTLSDARAVGIIQACDKIIYLYSDDYYNDEPIKELELIVAKNRGGSLGTIKIEFNLENGLMTEHK